MDTVEKPLKIPRKLKVVDEVVKTSDKPKVEKVEKVKVEKVKVEKVKVEKVKVEKVEKVKVEKVDKPKIVKGSQEAKDKMALVRSMRKKKAAI
jgi:hypothetical protein